MEKSPRGWHASGRQPSTCSESFKSHGFDVVVDNVEGFLCKIRLTAAVDMPCEEVYRLFSNRDNHNIFRSIDRVLAHRVVSETVHSKEVYVEQEASVGVLWIKKRFVTALHVTHCHESLKTTFRLAKPGMMTDFQGHWALSPLDADSYEALVPHHLVSPARDPERQTTLLYLEQDVAPALTQKVPPMMHGLLRRISKTAVVSLIQDVNTFAELRMEGIPFETILQSRVHGRGGLAARHLKHGRSYRVIEATTAADAHPEPAVEAGTALAAPVPVPAPPSSEGATAKCNGKVAQPVEPPTGGEVQATPVPAPVTASQIASFHLTDLT